MSFDTAKVMVKQSVGNQAGKMEPKFNYGNAVKVKSGPSHVLMTPR